MQASEVVIVGAGPVGLTLACELARYDIRFRIFDRALKPFDGSRGKTLQPRTLELMDDLGVIDRVLARGEYMPPVRTHLPNGESKYEHLFGDRTATSDTPYPRPFTIAQNLDEDILRQRLSELGGSIEYGADVVALEQDTTEANVTVSTENGEEKVRALYVVGCDGGRSSVRRLLDVAFEGDTDDSRRIYVADVRLEGLDQKTWHGFRNPGGMLNLAPLATTDLYQCQASIAPDAPEEPTLEALQDIVTTRSGRSDIRLLEMRWGSAWRLNVRLAAKYRVGRAFLAGDACHVHSPAGAQGLNTGFQDAYNLGWKLAAVLRGAPDDLLDTYEEERRPIAAWMLDMTSSLEAQAFEKKGFPADREESMLQLALNYRDASLSVERRATPGVVLAGDRLPDATGLVANGKSSRLFDLVRGPRPVVLAFGESCAGVLKILRSRYPDDQLAVFAVGKDIKDSKGELRANLGVNGDMLIVVRSDKYVGFAADAGRANEVERYLSRIIVHA